MNTQGLLYQGTYPLDCRIDAYAFGHREHYKLEPEAMSDLDEIWNYINKDLQNLAAARNTVEGMMDTIGKLKEFSEIGPSLTVITEFESDYRFLVCGNYLAFYRVTESDVSIDRILYGGRDYLRILFGDPSEYA